MQDFQTDKYLYSLAIEMSHAIDNSPCSCGSATVTLLAFPTYLVTGYSACPLTSLDGYDLIYEAMRERETIHVVEDYNRKRVFDEWKLRPQIPGFFNQVVALTERSRSELLKEGFGLVTPCADIITFPTYEFNGKSAMENLTLQLRQDLR